MAAIIPTETVLFSITAENWQQVEKLEELRLAYSERVNAETGFGAWSRYRQKRDGETPIVDDYEFVGSTTADGSEDDQMQNNAPVQGFNGQDVYFWNYMQGQVEILGSNYAYPDSSYYSGRTFDGEIDLSIWGGTYSYLHFFKFCAGSLYTSDEDYGWRKCKEIDANGDPIFTRGLAEAGDILGFWLVEDLVLAFNKMTHCWTVDMTTDEVTGSVQGYTPLDSGKITARFIYDRTHINQPPGGLLEDSDDIIYGTGERVDVSFTDENGDRIIFQIPCLPALDLTRRTITGAGVEGPVVVLNSGPFGGYGLGYKLIYYPPELAADGSYSAPSLIIHEIGNWTEEDPAGCYEYRETLLAGNDKHWCNIKKIRASGYVINKYYLYALSYSNYDDLDGDEAESYLRCSFDSDTKYFSSAFRYSKIVTSITGGFSPSITFAPIEIYAYRDIASGSSDEGSYFSGDIPLPAAEGFSIISAFDAGWFGWNLPDLDYAANTRQTIYAAFTYKPLFSNGIPEEE